MMMKKSILLGAILLTGASVAQADTLCELPEPGPSKTTVLVEATGNQEGYSAFDIEFEGVFDGNTLRYTVSNGDVVYNGLSNWALKIDECIEALVDIHDSHPEDGLSVGHDGLYDAYTVKWEIEESEYEEDNEGEEDYEGNGPPWTRGGHPHPVFGPRGESEEDGDDEEYEYEEYDEDLEWTFDLVLTGEQGVDWAIGEVGVYAKAGKHRAFRVITRGIRTIRNSSRTRWDRRLAGRRQRLG